MSKPCECCGIDIAMGWHLNCGPWLPGMKPRKKSEPKSPDELREIRAKAWKTRRARSAA